MPLDEVVQRVSDSGLGLSRPTRPGSFTGLMWLYESNYIRLGWLLDDLDELHGEYRSTAAGDFSLHAVVTEKHRYTTMLHLTYWFDVDGQRLADPDLRIRIYHDARLAEATSCCNSQRHSLLKSFDAHRGTELDRRWMRNMMLNKWLEYCADLGHRFAGAGSLEIHSYE